MSSKRLFRRLVSDYGLEREPHAVEVLRLALEALDRAAEARRALAELGTTYTDRFGQPHPRPEVAIERPLLSRAQPRRLRRRGQQTATDR